jgi:hypothetical protein
MHSCCWAAGLGCGRPQVSASPADPGRARIDDLAGTEPLTPGEEAAGRIVMTSRRHAVSSLIGPDQFSVFVPYGKPNRAPFPDPTENFPDTPI